MRQSKRKFLTQKPVRRPKLRNVIRWGLYAVCIFLAFVTANGGDFTKPLLLIPIALCISSVSGAVVSGGIGILFGTTGGYIIGFLFTGLLYWLITHFFGEKLPVMILALVLGLAVCYAFGTAWFMIVYAKDSGSVGLLTALGWCVFPFILPDCVKMALAILIGKRLPKRLIQRV